MMLFIAVFCLADSATGLNEGLAADAAVCVSCHRLELRGSHSAVACIYCHGNGSKIAGKSADSSLQAFGCVLCHKGYDRIFQQPMTARSGEKNFVSRSYGKFDSGFYKKNCASCHVQRCTDCHGSGHNISRPSVNDCQTCHKGYYTGWDYSGRAPREANMRYQRGLEINGETFLKMLPDVHYRAGMTCGACHSMSSLVHGKRASKTCLDCHKPSKKIIEHSITEHLQRLECHACHSAWGAQEYGTFFLRFRDAGLKEDFDLKAGASEEYLRSAYLKMQDAPPLGVNGAGRISPVRPQFIAFYTDIQTARNRGPENTLLAAEWRAFFPHTIQRGTVTCEGCHDNPRRFLLELESQRIYQLRKDGMKLDSFWSQSGQKMTNGSFMSASRYLKMSNKGAAYKKAYIQKWKQLINRVETSSLK